MLALAFEPHTGLGHPKDSSDAHVGAECCRICSLADGSHNGGLFFYLVLARIGCLFESDEAPLMREGIFHRGHPSCFPAMPRLRAPRVAATSGRLRTAGYRSMSLIRAFRASSRSGRSSRISQ